MFQAARSGKQANIEQMATSIRMQGATPTNVAAYARR